LASDSTRSSITPDKELLFSVPSLVDTAHSFPSTQVASAAVRTTDVPVSHNGKGASDPQPDMKHA
jgi:hypothetical protein